jgi:Arc/MetJ family transcription regulator
MPERNEDQLEEQLLERVYLFECLEEALEIARLHEKDRDKEFVHLIDRRLMPFVREEKLRAEEAVGAYKRQS